MPDITQIAIGNQIYDIKDAVARDSIATINTELDALQQSVGDAISIADATNFADADQSKIYVYTGDDIQDSYQHGHWYWYNTTATPNPKWEDGGVWGTAVHLEEDGSLTHSGQAADAEATGVAIGELKSQTDVLAKELKTSAILWERGSFNSSDSAPPTPSNYHSDYRARTPIEAPIVCGAGTTVTPDDGYYTFLEGYDYNTGEYFTSGIIHDETYTIAVDAQLWIVIRKQDETGNQVPLQTLADAITIVKKSTIDNIEEEITAFEESVVDTNETMEGIIGAAGSMAVWFEHGSIGSDGSDSSYNAQSRIRTKLLEFDVDFEFKSKDTTQAQRFFVAIYNADGTYKESIGWGKSYTVPKKTKFRIVASLTYNQNVAASVADILSAFQYTFKFESLIPDTGELPSYYFENDYIQNKALTVASYYQYSPKLAMFGWLTDTHMRVNAKQSFKLMKYLDDHSNSVPFVICGGDVIGHTDSVADVWDQEMQWIDMMSDYGKRQVLHCRGNHDLLGDQGASSLLDRSTRFVYLMRNQDLVIPSSNNFYYYYDIPFTDVRVIVVDDFDGAATGGASKFTQTQLNWILNTALNTSNKHIVFVSHVTADPDMGWYEENMEPLQVIMDALKQKSNLNATADGFTLVHDFTGTTNTLVCCLCGHGHNDESHVDASGVLTIMTNCDANANSTSGYDRTPGTINEQCFDIVTIDTENESIYLTRIGSGSDRSFTY